MKPMLRPNASGNRRAICEAIELPLGMTFMSTEVHQPATSLEAGRKPHFHGLCEIVWFRRGGGEFIAEGWQRKVSPGSAVYVPSMRRHDYHLQAGVKEWVLVQFYPYLLDKLNDSRLSQALSAEICVRPDPRQAERLDMLLKWLTETASEPASDHLALRLLGLVLNLMVDSPREMPDMGDPERDAMDRLRPALDEIHQNPGADHSITSLAGRCGLSGPYFSRQFTRLMGMGFVAYLRNYRLHLAAQRLLSDGCPVSVIGYDLGFLNSAYFSTAFTQRFGVAPREYRRMMERRWS